MELTDQGLGKRTELLRDRLRSARIYAFACALEVSAETDSIFLFAATEDCRLPGRREPLTQVFVQQSQ